MSERIVELILTVFGAGSVGTVLTYIFTKKKTKAETQAINADSIESNTNAQSQIIKDLNAHITWMRSEMAEMRDRQNAQDERMAAMEKTESRRGRLLVRMSIWQQKAFDLMTTEQRVIVGPPPRIDEVPEGE